MAGIAVGYRAEIKLSALDGTTVVAVDARQLQALAGSVVGVDAAASTITVSTMNSGVATQTTFTVAPTATLTIDGVAATLDQFVAGVRVSLKTDPMDATVVASITATGKQVEGRVSAVDPVSSTLTIAARRGVAATTYVIGPTVPVAINGAASTLAAMVVGAKAELRLSALDGITVISVRARI
jgi:hypothetical protein